MRKSIFCVLLSVVLLTGVFSPATLAEQADAAQITDDMTDWSIAAYHSENWERFLSHPESGLGVIGRGAAGGESSVTYAAPAGKRFTRLNISLQLHKDFYNSRHISVSALVSAESEWRGIAFTEGETQDISGYDNFKTKNISAYLPENTVAVRVCLLNDVAWTLFIDRVELYTDDISEETPVYTVGPVIKQASPGAHKYSPKYEQSALQFDSAALKSYKGLSLISSGTVLFKGVIKNKSNAEEIYAAAQTNGAIILERTETTGETDSRICYSARLYGITENGKENERYSAFAYAVYGSGEDEMTVIGEPINGKYSNEPSEKETEYMNFTESENSWIASLQLADGAIVTRPPSGGAASINPYFANISAAALLKSGSRYTENVKKYMDWYLVHLNNAAENVPDGSVFDYNVYISADGSITETSAGDFDSTDSYAATFLRLVSEYCNTVGNYGYFNSNFTAIQRIYSAMLSTWDHDKKLTAAKPAYRFYYLMDNCEVYDGAAAYRSLLKATDRATAEVSARIADILCGIESLYQNESYLNFYGNTAFNWETWYSDATAQLFPIMLGVIDANSARAAMLYSKFNSLYSGGGSLGCSWERLDNPSGMAWSLIAFTAALTGDTEKADSFITAYRQRFSAQHGSPLYNADAAFAVLAANELLKLC